MSTSRSPTLLITSGIPSPSVVHPSSRVSLLMILLKRVIFDNRFDWIDIIWLHIRAVGEWTNRLYNYFNMEATVKASLTIDRHMSQINYREFMKENAENGDQNGSPMRRTKSSSAFNATSKHLLRGATVMVLPVPVDCNEYGCGRQALNEKKRNDVEMAASPVSKSSFTSLTQLKSAMRSMSEPHILKNAIILDRPLKVRWMVPMGRLLLTYSVHNTRY